MSFTAMAATTAIIASSLIRPAVDADKMPVSKLSGSYIAAPATHPFLYTKRSDAQAFLAYALLHKTGAEAGRHQALYRLQVSMVMPLLAPANASVLRGLETPQDTDDIATYQKQFSVSSGGPLSGTGAALMALDLAYYAYLVKVSNGAYGDAGTAARAKAAANAIVSNWAATGFRRNGAFLAEYNQYRHESEPTASDQAAWSGIALQVGRGMKDYVLAVDLLDDGTMPNRPVVLEFLRNQLHMLIGATNYHYIFGSPFRSARYENQSADTLSTILLLARYLGQADIVKNVAGDQNVPQPIWMSWPQEVEGAIYGRNDNATSTPPAAFCKATQKCVLGTPELFHNPVAALGEVTDRARGPAPKEIGYPDATLFHLLEAAKELSDAGYSPYTFVAANGASLQAGIDYYAKFVINYMTLQAHFILPASDPTIPDFSYYAGKQYTGNATGSAVRDADQLVDCALIGSQAYPNDATMASAVSTTLSRYATVADPATGRTTTYIPFDEVSTEVLLLWKAPASE